MKAQSLLPNDLPFYQQMIKEVTNAPVAELAIIENIMRDEVFHSTLDWQSREEFAQGAKEAYAIFHDDPVFCHRVTRARSLRWRISRWEDDLLKARKRGSAKTIERLETQLRFAHKDLETIESTVMQTSAANYD